MMVHVCRNDGLHAGVLKRFAPKLRSQLLPGGMSVLERTGIRIRTGIEKRNMAKDQNEFRRLHRIGSHDVLQPLALKRDVRLKFRQRSPFFAEVRFIFPRIEADDSQVSMTHDAGIAKSGILRIFLLPRRQILIKITRPTSASVVISASHKQRMVIRKRTFSRIHDRVLDRFMPLNMIHEVAVPDRIVRLQLFRQVKFTRKDVLHFVGVIHHDETRRLRVFSRRREGIHFRVLDLFIRDDFVCAAEIDPANCGTVKVFRIRFQTIDRHTDDAVRVWFQSPDGPACLLVQFVG